MALHLIKSDELQHHTNWYGLVRKDRNTAQELHDEVRLSQGSGGCGQIISNEQASDQEKSTVNLLIVDWKRDMVGRDEDKSSGIR